MIHSNLREDHCVSFYCQLPRTSQIIIHSLAKCETRLLDFCPKSFGQRFLLQSPYREGLRPSLCIKLDVINIYFSREFGLRSNSII